jgi:hypothetical protein
MVVADITWNINTLPLGTMIATMLTCNTFHMNCRGQNDQSPLGSGELGFSVRRN